MAHSVFHARSSARQFGGSETDYLELHNWMDATKSIRADFKHRALRHHLEAVGFYQAFHLPINGVRIHRIMYQHLEEDFPTKPLPSYADWFKGEKDWPSWTRLEIPPYKTICQKLCKKFGGEPEDYFFCAIQLTHGARALKHHSWGIFDVEDQYGVTFNRESDNKPIPTRTVCENIITQIYGRIPTPMEWTDFVIPEKWMFADAKQLSKEL